MDTTKRMFALAIAGAALAAAAPLVATAQPAWPTKPVRIVIPFGVGGGSDVWARMLAQDLSTRWGQQVIVDNKAGGDTVIAASEVQRAAPDGYTLLMTINTTLTLTPHMMAKVQGHQRGAARPHCLERGAHAAHLPGLCRARDGDSR